MEDLCLKYSKNASKNIKFNELDPLFAHAIDCSKLYYYGQLDGWGLFLLSGIGEFAFSI